MAKNPFERIGTQGGSKLPPLPAPPARDANPWTFSETARQVEPEAASGAEHPQRDLDWARFEHEGDEARQARPERPSGVDTQDAEREPGFGKLLPVVILLIMFASLARELIEAQGRGEARLQTLLALVVMAAYVGVFVALRLTSRRRRRR